MSGRKKTHQNTAEGIRHSESNQFTKLDDHVRWKSIAFLREQKKKIQIQRIYRFSPSAANLLNIDNSQYKQNGSGNFSY